MNITFTKNGVHAEIRPEDFDFEAVCPVCTLGKMPSGVPCSTCDGSGIVLTPLGQHVIAFVVSHGKKYQEKIKKAVADRQRGGAA